MRSTPPFPCSLATLVPPSVLATCAAAELGALYRLLEAAWEQTPACSLVNDRGYLASVARVGLDQWPLVERAVLTVFTPGPDGRLHAPTALAAHCRHEDIRKTRTRAARARWGADPPPPDACADAHAHPYAHAHAYPHASPVPPAPPERQSAPVSALALQRSNPLVDNPALSAERSGSVLGRVGAEARALDRQQRDRVRVRRILANARWEWAGDRQQTVPVQVIEHLATGPNADPALASFAVEQIETIGRAWVAGTTTRKPNPIALLIAAFGARLDKPSKPWDVPLVYRLEHDKREELNAKVLAARNAARAAPAARTGDPS